MRNYFTTISLNFSYHLKIPLSLNGIIAMREAVLKKIKISKS